MDEQLRTLDTAEATTQYEESKSVRYGSLRRMSAIARNAFREAVRDRVLYNLVLFVLLLTGASIFIGELSGGQERKVIVDLGLSAMLLFGMFIAIFVGVGLVYKEIERRTIYAVFSKPVGRGEFLVGKYLGLCLTLLVNVLVMGVGVSLALLYVSRGWDPLIPTIWPAVLLIYIELMLLTAIALLFSSFSSPALSALLTFLIFVVGHFSADLKILAALWAAPARAGFLLVFITCCQISLTTVLLLRRRMVARPQPDLCSRRRCMRWSTSVWFWPRQPSSSAGETSSKK